MFGGGGCQKIPIVCEKRPIKRVGNEMSICDTRDESQGVYVPGKHVKRDLLCVERGLYDRVENEKWTCHTRDESRRVDILGNYFKEELAYIAGKLCKSQT